MEGGKDRLPLIAEILPRRGRHGGADGGVVLLIAVAPVPAQGIRAVPGLAAGEVGADIGIAVAACPGAVHGVGPGGHGLGLQGLRLKVGGHFRRYHPRQVFLHGHVIDLSAALDQQPLRRGQGGRSGGRYRRWAGHRRRRRYGLRGGRRAGRRGRADHGRGACTRFRLRPVLPAAAPDQAEGRDCGDKQGQIGGENGAFHWFSSVFP